MHSDQCISYITSEAIYLSHPASESLTSAKTAWWASIKTVNHETHNNHEVEGSRPRGPVQPSFWFCRRRAELPKISVSDPHAMRVGLKPSSALRAPRRARWRRPRHRGSSFSFPHPPSPQDTHRIYLVRHPAINKHHLPAGVHIQAHMVRHSPHPILSAGIVHGPALLWSHLFASRPSHLRLSGLRGLSCCSP